MQSFKNFYDEMVMSVGEQDFSMDPDFTEAKKIVQIGNYDILRLQNGIQDCYAISIDQQVCSWIILRPYGNMEQIHSVRTLPQYRRQHLADNLLIWLTGNIDKDIISSDIMSDDAIEWRKFLSKSGRIAQYWLNIKTGEEHEYNPDLDNADLKPYRSRLPTDWRLVIRKNTGIKKVLEHLDSMGVINLDLFNHI
jgi:hypothetical protein